MPSDRIDRAAQLLERLVADAGMRAEFRARPVAALQHYGLDDVAREVGDRPVKGLHTLDLRESRSGLAGLFVAAAAGGARLMHLVAQLPAHQTPEAAQTVQRAITRSALPVAHSAPPPEAPAAPPPEAPVAPPPAA